MLRNDSLIEGEFQVHGAWWRPGLQEDRIRGTLNFRAGEAMRLDLAGVFHGLPPFDPNGVPILVGQSESGTFCTLLENHEISRQPALATDLERSSFVCGRFIDGCAFKKEDDICLTRMLTKLTYLEEWLHVGGPSVDFMKDRDAEWTVRFPYTTKEIFRVGLPGNDFSLSVQSSWNKHLGRSELRFHREPLVLIESAIPQRLSWFENKQLIFQHLLTLLVGEPVLATAVKASFNVMAPDGKTEKENGGIYASFGRPQVRKLIGPQMILPYQKIAPRCAEIVARWYSAAEELGPVYKLFFATLRNSTGYVESEFLMLMQALESFHRCRYSGSYVDEALYGKYYDRMVASLPSDIPPSLRQKLVNHLRHGNEFSLRKRLQQLLRQLPAGIKVHLYKSETNFIELVVETRNQLTHPGIPSQGLVLKEVLDFWGTNITLRQVLTLLLLETIGLGEKDIEIRNLFG